MIADLTTPIKHRYTDVDEHVAAVDSLRKKGVGRVYVILVGGDPWRAATGTGHAV